jgi:hypothetical protein
LFDKKKQSGAEPISLADRRPAADPAEASPTDPDPVETVDVAPQAGVQIVEAAVEVEAEETEEGGDSSDLLSMFTETKIETVDHTLLVGMAGDVDIDDVVAELQLIAAALNIGNAGLREAA